MTRKNWLRIAIIGGFTIILTIFYFVGGFDFFSLETYQATKNDLISYYQNNQLEFIVYFIGAYMLVTALSLPVATVFTLSGGAIMGWQLATPIIVVAASVASLVPFYAGRFALQQWIEQKFSDSVKKLNKGLQRDGWLYLFSARMNAAIPFYALNFASGATEMSARTYFSATLAGITPGVIVYSYAGTQLGDATRASDVVSFQVVLALIGISLVPLIGKYLQRQYSGSESRGSDG